MCDLMIDKSHGKVLDQEGHFLTSQYLLFIVNMPHYLQGPYKDFADAELLIQHLGIELGNHYSIFVRTLSNYCLFTILIEYVTIISTTTQRLQLLRTFF